MNAVAFSWDAVRVSCVPDSWEEAGVRLFLR